MSLTHWWPLDGDLKDKITGQQLWNYNAYITEEGKIGSAYNFDYNLESYLSQPFTYTPPANKISIALWFKWNSNGGSYWEDIFTIGEYYNNAWESMPIVICIDTDGDLYVSIANGYTALGISGPTYPLNIGEWYHVAATIDNRTVTLYINGEKVSEVTTNFSVDFNEYGNEFLIGGNGSEVGNYTINDVRFYDHVLSTAEIKELNKALIVHYTFDDTTWNIDQNFCVNEAGLQTPNLMSGSMPIETSNAAVGSGSLNCQGATSITIFRKGEMNAPATASMWINTLSQYPASNAVVFADYRSKLAFGFFGTQNAIISCGQAFEYPVNIKAKWKTGWNHIVVRRNIDNTIQCFLNGDALTNTTSANYWSHSTTLIVGCRNNGSNKQYFTGLIDDFRFYTTALTNTEIQELYNCGGRVSDRGDVLTGSFIESAAAIQVNKNKTITLDATNEILFDEINHASFKKDGTVVARQIIEI